MALTAANVNIHLQTTSLILNKNFFFTKKFPLDDGNFLWRRQADKLLMLNLLAQSNEPVLTGPARLYLATITPLGVTTPSVNINAAGMAPSPNSFFPSPSVNG